MKSFVNWYFNNNNNENTIAMDSIHSFQISFDNLHHKYTFSRASLYVTFLHVTSCNLDQWFSTFSVLQSVTRIFLGSYQFSQLLQETTLSLNMVKSDSKIIISFRYVSLNPWHILYDFLTNSDYLRGTLIRRKFFLSAILRICDPEIASFLEPIVWFTVILGLFICEFIIWEPIFGVPISRI